MFLQQGVEVEIMLPEVFSHDAIKYNNLQKYENKWTPAR